jgi:hypothetical protein
MSVNGVTVHLDKACYEKAPRKHFSEVNIIHINCSKRFPERFGLASGIDLRKDLHSDRVTSKPLKRSTHRRLCFEFVFKPGEVSNVLRCRIAASSEHHCAFSNG